MTGNDDSIDVNERASEMTIFKSSGEQREGIYKTVVMERQKIKEETTATLNSAALTRNAALC